MHDYILGFVCFMAGALFVAIIGIPLLEGPPQEPPPPTRAAADTPPVEPQPWPWRDPDRHLHPPWPECDCPSEAFHTKYYPAAGIES
jgi:hypothetical protein